MKVFVKYFMVSVVCILTVFLSGCEQDVDILEQDQLTEIDPRIESLVDDVPGSETIKHELEKELQFLVDNGYVDIDQEYLNLEYFEPANDYLLQYNYDQSRIISNRKIESLLKENEESDNPAN